MSIWIKNSPIFLIVAGIVSFFLSTLPDGGFVKGLFQGAGIALVVLASYYLFLTYRPRRGLDQTPMWRPSKDVLRDDRG